MTHKIRKPGMDKFAHVGLEGSLLSCLLDHVFRRNEQNRKQYLVLLIDLEPKELTLITANLERERYRVKTADSWRSCENTERSESMPDLIVTGATAVNLQEIIGFAQPIHMPVIAIGNPERLGTTETPPVTKWLARPFNILELVVSVKTLLGNTSEDVPAALVEHF